MADDQELARKYQKLQPHEHCLARPGMYIGSVEVERCLTWVWDDATSALVKREIDYIPGLYKIYDEVLVNCIDHATRLAAAAATACRLKAIKVTVDRASGEIEVFNDGDGIDVAMHPEHGIWVPERIFGQMLSGTNYDDDEATPRMVGGQNGLGAKCANIFSRWFEVETVDAARKKVYTQTFRDNMNSNCTPVVRACAKKPYTRVRFLPDYARFGCEGLSQDMYALFAKRAFDACALTGAEVSVWFNGTKLEYKTFERYADLYLGPKAGRPRVYEKLNDNWEVIAACADEGGFDHVSFVNGIWTIMGGRHVDHLATQVARRACELLQARRKMDHLKPAHVRDKLLLFVRCAVPNAAFNSQSKETMITPVSKWGCKVEVTDGFVDKLCKAGLADLVQEASDAAAAKALKQTDGKKRSVLRGIPKLHDASDAGGRNSDTCALILTEGDSALAMAISGRSVVGTSRYGAFPLKGKVGCTHRLPESHPCLF